jgi:hypothetical protein
MCLGFHWSPSLCSLTVIFNMPQPKWYHKSLAELCMDSIVDNMEKWTALRSSEHVSSLFYLLRECLFFGIIVCFYLIMPFWLHTASHCLEYMTECLLKDYSITEDMFDLLFKSPHTKVLDLSQDYLGTGYDANRNFRIVRLASVRCLVIQQFSIIIVVNLCVTLCNNSNSLHWRFMMAAVLLISMIKEIPN